MVLTHRVIEAVIHQHPSSVSVLWEARDASGIVFRYSLPDLDHLDQRIEAHIDGLRVAGEEGWQNALREMAWKEAGEVFAAAVLAFESGAAGRVDEVLRVAAGKVELARGVISALGWMEYEAAASHIQKLCTSELRSHRRIGIAGAAIHRKDPGRPLEAALSSGDRLLRARAAKAVGELGRRDLVSFLQPDLASPEPGCRFWSAWSSALVAGYISSLQVLQNIAEAPGPYRVRALQLALRRMHLPEAHRWLERLGRSQGGARMQVIAAGVLGDPILISWLIEQMSIPELARVAGESFTSITGADLAYLDLNRKAPEDFNAGPTEDPADDNVEMDPDERLPWPNPLLIQRWFDARRAEFTPGVRYLIGKPIAPDWAERVLRIGKQRQRAAAALELAIARPGSILFEVRAPGFRQQELLNYRSFR